MNLNHHPIPAFPTTKQYQHDRQPQPQYFQRFHTLTVSTHDQYIKMKNNLNWRHTTSMPIVKVASYRQKAVQTQNNSRLYIFKVELQPITISIDHLNNMTISEAVYTIRQALLGIQTLTIKYNTQFDASRWFIGVNEKGQLKIWINNNLIKDGKDNVNQVKMSMGAGMKKTSQTIQCLFQLVKHSVRATSKPIFQNIGKILFGQNQITYSQAHAKLRQICFKNDIFISNSLANQTVQSHRFKSKDKLTIIRNSVQKHYKKAQQLSTLSKKQVPANNMTSSLACKGSIKSKLSYNSPKNNINASELRRNKWHPSSKGKPKIAWSYANSANKFNPTDNKQLRSVNRQAECDDYIVNNSNKKALNQGNVDTMLRSIQLCNSVPIKMNNYKLMADHMKHQSKQNIRDEVTIQQFNPYQQEDHSIEILKQSEVNSVWSQKIQSTSTNTHSTKHHQESKLSFDGSLFIQNFKQAKNSTVTTNNSLNTERGKDSTQIFKQKCFNVNKLEEMIDNTKAIVNSIMIQTPLISRVHQQSSRLYDFGGLITIEDKGESASVSGNGEISGKQVESLQASRDASMKEKQKLQQANNQNLTSNMVKIDFDLLCGIDIMSKFFNKQCKDLKQSVWCGQQKKAEHLNIKLQKLGHLGRQIKASFVPEYSEQMNFQL